MRNYQFCSDSVTRKDNVMKKIIIQWEIGRIFFNLFLLGIGLINSFQLIFVLGIFLYILSVCFYGLIANICYSLGPLLDLYLKNWDIELGKTRSIVFALGLAFSIVLTYYMSNQFTLRWGNFDLDAPMKSQYFCY